MKRTLAGFLAIIMLISSMPISVFAVDDINNPDAISEGSTGEAEDTTVPECICAIECTENESNTGCEACMTDIEFCSFATSDPDLVCTCDIKCTETNSECEVCTDDFSACTGKVCNCTEKCSAANENCDLCSENYEECLVEDSTPSGSGNEGPEPDDGDALPTPKYASNAEYAPMVLEYARDADGVQGGVRNSSEDFNFKSTYNEGVLTFMYSGDAKNEDALIEELNPKASGLSNIKVVLRKPAGYEVISATDENETTYNENSDGFIVLKLPYYGENGYIESQNNYLITLEDTDDSSNNVIYDLTIVVTYEGNATELTLDIVASHPLGGELVYSWYVAENGGEYFKVVSAAGPSFTYSYNNDSVWRVKYVVSCAGVANSDCVGYTDITIKVGSDITGTVTADAQTAPMVILYPGTMSDSEIKADLKTGNPSGNSAVVSEIENAEEGKFSYAYSLKKISAGDYKLAVRYSGGYATVIQNVSVSGDDIEMPSISVLKLGDSNNDGMINVSDIVKMRNVILRKDSLSASEKLAADVNGDGEVNVADIVKIRNYILMRIDSFE